MLNEFKQFIMRGNILDLAIGVIMGTSFGAIVTSLVNDLIMPPIGKLTGNVDFKDLFLSLNGKHYPTLAAAKAAAAPTVNYGLFFNTVLNFVIVAFVVFLLIKQINRLTGRGGAAHAAASIKECRYCASTIPMRATRCPHCTSELEALSTH